MDYKYIYYSIIEKAKNEDKDGKRSIGYFEKHHIKPKSLGGLNDESNLVKLTAREHFICHWLLVKIYQKGSIERNKMLYALWRMQKGNDSSHKEHYINARAYEKLRIEFAQTISELTSQTQLGEKNSQYGKKWYTSIITGESHSYFEKPDNNWIEGRNWFKTAKYEIYNIKTHQRIYDVKNKLKSNRNENFINKIKLIWNEFINSNINSVIQFNKMYYPTINLHRHFRNYISEYKDHKKNLTIFIK